VTKIKYNSEVVGGP